MAGKLDKRCIVHDTPAVRERAARGMALSAREFAAISGLSYHRVRVLWKRPGFPVCENTITMPDYQEWKRQKFGWTR